MAKAVKLVPYVDVDGTSVRHLRDGAEAFPAMLAAIAGASREVLLEMYWIGADRIGAQFRDALVACARRGVGVFVLYDCVGSLQTPASFWQPVVDAGDACASFRQSPRSATDSGRGEF